MGERPPKARGASNPNIMKIQAPTGKRLIATIGDTAYLEDESVIAARLGHVPGTDAVVEYWRSDPTGGQDDATINRYLALGYRHESDQDGRRHRFIAPEAHAQAHIKAAQDQALARVSQKKTKSQDLRDMGEHGFSVTQKEGSLTVGKPSADSLLDD